MNPGGVWSQITTLVWIPIDEYREEAVKLGTRMGIGGYWTNPTDFSTHVPFK